MSRKFRAERSASAGAFAYLLWKFPKLSETFIVEELLAIGRRGLLPVVISCERPAEEHGHPGVAELTERVTCIKEQPRRARLAAGGLVVVRHPLKVARCAIWACWPPERLALVNLWRALLVARMLERRGIEYLHAHFADSAGEVALFASTITGVPFGVTLHAADIYLRAANLRRVAYRAALRVTVCSYNVKELVARCPRLSESDLLVKPAGIDPERFSLGAPRPSRPARYLLAVGRLEEKKGFDVLLRALGLLTLTHVQDVRCRIVGSGGELERLERLAETVGVRHLVEFSGDRSPEEVARIMADSDLFVAPSKVASWGDRDSMPVVLKEAMAMELPIVASDAFGIPELVSPEAGKLVPPDDPEALARAIAEVMRMTPEERAAMGRAGRRIVESKFAEDRCAAPLVAAFRKVLESDGGHRLTTFPGKLAPWHHRVAG